MTILISTDYFILELYVASELLSVMLPHRVIRKGKLESFDNLLEEFECNYSTYKYYFDEISNIS
jgi:hypothetical protein